MLLLLNGSLINRTKLVVPVLRSSKFLIIRILMNR